MLEILGGFMAGSPEDVEDDGAVVDQVDGDEGTGDEVPGGHEGLGNGKAVLVAAGVQLVYPHGRARYLPLCVRVQ